MVNSNLLHATHEFTKSIQEWNISAFGNIFRRKYNILARLTGLQSSIHYPTSIFLQNVEQQLIMEYKHLLILLENFWKLKFRINWLNSGDANTKFFHLSTINRWWQNRITAIQDQGEIRLTNPNHIKEHVILFYKNLFTTTTTLSLIPIMIIVFHIMF